MEITNFFGQLDIYDHLDTAGKKAMDVYVLQLTDEINHKDNNELYKVQTCPLCCGKGCDVCHTNGIQRYDLINEAIVRYLEKVLFKLFGKRNNLDQLFHPLVVKTALNKERYEGLFRDILGLEYTEYVAMIKYGNTTREARNSYPLYNIHTVDFDNNIEVNLCDRYLSYLLEEKTNLNYVEGCWIVRYLSMKKAHNLDVEIKLSSLNLRIFVKMEKINLLNPLSLKKMPKIISQLGWEQDLVVNGQMIYLIMVNPLGIYMHNLSLKKPDLVTEMCITSYHEMRHTLQSKMIKEDSLPNFEVLLWARENLIHDEYEEYYDINYDDMAIEIDARIASYEQALKTLKKYSPKIYASKKDELIILIQSEEFMKNISIQHFLGQYNTRDNMTREMVDIILRGNPSLIHEYPSLSREYNENGTRKDTVQLIKDEKRFRDKMKNLQDELYREPGSDEEFKEGQVFLSQAWKDGIRLFDELIFLSLEKKDTSYIEDTCNRLYVEDMRRIVNGLSSKVGNSLMRKVDSLTAYQTWQSKKEDWLINDKVYAGHYAEGLRIQQIIERHIQMRQDVLEESVGTKVK